MWGNSQIIINNQTELDTNMWLGVEMTRIPKPVFLCGVYHGYAEINNLIKIGRAALFQKLNSPIQTRSFIFTWMHYSNEIYICYYQLISKSVIKDALIYCAIDRSRKNNSEHSFLNGNDYILYIESGCYRPACLGDVTYSRFLSYIFFHELILMSRYCNLCQSIVLYSIPHLLC